MTLKSYDLEIWVKCIENNIYPEISDDVSIDMIKECESRAMINSSKASKIGTVIKDLQAFGQSRGR